MAIPSLGASGPSLADARVLILTGDGELADTVLAAAASVDVPAVHDADPALLARPWRAVVVGVDQAAAAARHGPVDAGTWHVVGRAGDEEVLCGWSATLGATIAVLPDGVRALSASLAGATGARATVLGVVGGSGGVGSTTLAVGLADLAARRGLRTLLADLDPRGGGVDLALGLERTPGRRWSGFAAARGFVGDVQAHLPPAPGLGVLAWDRDPEAEVPGSTAIASVLRSTSRTHEVVVVDLARGGGDLASHIALCDGTVVVGVATVPGLAAARAVVAEADPTAPLAVVARPGVLGGDELARGLGVPLLGTLPHDRAVAGALDRGEPAGRVAGRAYRRALASIAERVLP
ncbi:septum site-determining protein Ssd [Mariniluteicoccus flavus]